MVLELNEIGHYTVHPRNQGGIGDPDHVVLSRATRENLVIVTANARDFRALVAKEAIHPGMILIPSTSRERSKRLILSAIDYLVEQGDPEDLMVNHVLEVDASAEDAIQFSIYPLPAGGKE